MPIEINSYDESSIVKTEDQALQRAILKWVHFMQDTWAQVSDKDAEKSRKKYELLGTVFRVVIIILSTVVTTISDISEVPRTVITIIAGTLTMLTGIEAYFRFSERGQIIQQKQREIQALRDDLRYRWMNEVELEPNFSKRMAAAKKLLDSGPKAYNNILNKYILKRSDNNNPSDSTNQ